MHMQGTCGVYAGHLQHAIGGERGGEAALREAQCEDMRATRRQRRVRLAAEGRVVSTPAAHGAVLGARERDAACDT